MEDGRLKFAGLGLNHFTLSQIARQDGDDRLSNDPSLLAAEACEKKDCRLTSASGLKIALVWNEALLPQACLQADVVVTRLHTQQTCQAILIDALFLQQRGAVQGVITSGQLVVVSDHTPLRDRPWAPVVESKERTPQKK